MVFAVVALALIWKRVVKPNAPFAENAKPITITLLLVASCIGKAPGTTASYSSINVARTAAARLVNSWRTQRFCWGSLRSTGADSATTLLLYSLTQPPASCC